MHNTSESILEAFNQLPELEKHAIGSEIIKQVALLDFPPVSDDELMEIADMVFRMHDEAEKKDSDPDSYISSVGGDSDPRS